MGVGAIVGAIAWLALPSASPVPQIGRVFLGAFIGVGLHGLIFGQLSFVGRGGTPVQIHGKLARLISGLMIVTSAVFSVLG